MLKSLLAFTLICLLCAPQRAVHAQEPPKEPPVASSVETYRLRVENIQFGRIEVSLDQGRHFILIGRVARPAARTAAEKDANAPGTVLRGQREGLAFCTGPGRILKLRPERPVVKSPKNGKLLPAPPEPTAVLTDIPMGKSLFAELLPPAGTSVRLISGRLREASFPEAYSPDTEDTFVFHVRLPVPDAPKEQAEAQREEGLREQVRRQVTEQQKEYADAAPVRARAAGHKVVGGTLTLRAMTPDGEPDPIRAVQYFVDGSMIAAQDTAPFVYLWNTRAVEEGEHVIEIRALNQNVQPISRVRTLVVVQNRPPVSSAP